METGIYSVNKANEYKYKNALLRPQRINKGKKTKKEKIIGKDQYSK